MSDRNMKRDFAPVDRDEILAALPALPISSWRYKTEESGARHIGPMAQDFMPSFHVGSSDKTIFQIDADGVAFAAIQALYAEVKRPRQAERRAQRRGRNLARRNAAAQPRARKLHDGFPPPPASFDRA